MKWLIILIVSCFARDDILSLINTERKLYKLKPVEYNIELEDDLEMYDEVFGSKLINEGILEYATFDKYKKSGYKFLTRGIYKHSMRNNIKYRLNNQRHCIDPKKCSNKKFDDFKSCIKDDEDRCDHIYYPMYLIKSLDSISCIDLKREDTYFCYGRTGKLVNDRFLEN